MTEPCRCLFKYRTSQKETKKSRHEHKEWNEENQRKIRGQKASERREKKNLHEAKRNHMNAIQFRCDGKWIKMSYKRARKILHSNGIEYVRIHHDKKQIVMNQVITLYGKSIEHEEAIEQNDKDAENGQSEKRERKKEKREWKRRMKATGDGSNKRNILRPYKLFIRGQFSVWCFPYLFSFCFRFALARLLQWFFLLLFFSLLLSLLSYCLLNDVPNSKKSFFCLCRCSLTLRFQKEIWFERLQ